MVVIPKPQPNNSCYIHFNCRSGYIQVEYRYIRVEDRNMIILNEPGFNKQLIIERRGN